MESNQEKEKPKNMQKKMELVALTVKFFDTTNKLF